MKIHSKFSDYYDSALGLGIDENVSWVRTTQPVDNRRLPDKMLRWRSPAYYLFPTLADFKDAPKEAHSCSVDCYVVVLAGKIYPGITISFFPIESGFKTHASPLAQHWCCSIDQLNETCLKYGSTWIKDQLERYRKIKTGHMRRSGVTQIPALTRFFNYSDGVPQTDVDKLLHDIGSPVLLFSIVDNDVLLHRYKPNFKCISNPCLKGIGFASVLDPYTAFQELSMYMSGVLGTQSAPTAKISDEHQKMKKGFDDASFKNRGTKKPRRKSKNKNV